MTDSFTSALWQGIADVYRAILAHPFVTGLADGSLPHDAFTFHVVQDALYLPRYAKALAAVASRAPDAAGTEMFARHAPGVIASSRRVTALAGLGIDPAAAAAAEPAPATLAYTSYLLATIGGGSYAERAGAVLPCYWIYREAGKELPRRGSPDTRYQQWIDMYEDEDFGEIVRGVLAVANGLGPGLAPCERARVHQHFRTSSRYEWMFRDMGRPEGEPACLTTHDRHPPQPTQHSKQLCPACTASAADVAGAQRRILSGN